MSVFIGDFVVKIDQKGRFLFPSAMLNQLPDGNAQHFVVKKDIYEKCLTVFTMQEWEKQCEKIRKRLNPFNREHNIFLREFYKDTAETTLDSNNRMLIPKRLAQQVLLNNDILLLGLDNKIEIWCNEIYIKSKINVEDYKMLAEKILGNIFVENIVDN
mgnify:CR=1 FL=1